MTIETAPNMMENCDGKGAFSCYYILEIGIEVDVQTVIWSAKLQVAQNLRQGIPD
jgi:hypothetical protein